MSQTLVLLLLSIQLFVQADSPYKLAATQYPPFMGKELKNGGLVTDIVTQSFHEAGKKVEVKFYPWNRAVSMAKSGEVDAIVHLWKRDRRKNWAIFSDAIINNEFIFYKQRGSKIPFTKKNYLDLTNLRIAVAHGYAYPKDFEKVKDKFKITKVKGDLQALRMLANNRIDLYIIEKTVALSILNKQDNRHLKAKISPISIPLTIEPAYLGVSKQSPRSLEIIKTFNKGLKKLKKKHSVPQFLKEHDLADH